MIKVTERRTALDWAGFIEEIATQYEQAEKITLVMHNLNTHKAVSFNEKFHICIGQAYKIRAIKILADHVHLFLEFHPSTSLSKVVQYLKGGISNRLFKLHPELKKRYWGGSLWSSGKFFQSVGNVTADTIKHYIEESQGETESRDSIVRVQGIRATKI